MGQIWGSGTGNWANAALVDSTGRLFVDTSGTVSITETDPDDPTKNNPALLFEYAISGTSAGVTGSRIGSITQFIGTGSFVSTITYANNAITNIGSWS